MISCFRKATEEIVSVLEFEDFIAPSIVDKINPNVTWGSNDPFQIIEIGAGYGLKTKLLLEFLLRFNTNIEYIPIDILKNFMMN